MPTLDASIGGAASNSYCTTTEADAYFEARLNSRAWVDSLAENKARALIQSAARLNQENWVGSRVNAVQALAWPRNYAPRKDSPHGGYDFFGYWSGYLDYYPIDAIPTPVTQAQMELAIAYLEGFEDGATEQISSYAMDGLKVEKRAQTPQGALPATVSRLLSGLIRGVRLVRA